MAIQTRSDLKNLFVTGAKPTQTNFADLFDSYWHMDDGVATESWVGSNFAPISDSDNYIQSQNASVQNADFWVNTGKFSGSVTFGGVTSDPAYVKAASFYRTDTDKLRLGIGGTYKNMATEDWVQTNAVQLNPSVAQPGSFNLTGGGECRLASLMINNGNVSAPDMLSFGTSGIANIYRSAGGLDMNYNGYYHLFSGFYMRFPRSTADIALVGGATYFHSTTSKFRSCNGGVWSNFAMEDWTTTNFLGNQLSAVESKSFWINGSAYFSSSYNTGVSVFYGNEGNAFGSAWYVTLSPRGVFTGTNSGGSPFDSSVYIACNSFIEGRSKVSDPQAYFTTYVQPYNIGNRNEYDIIGFESIVGAANVAHQYKVGGYFAALNDLTGGSGPVHMIGSEHVVKNISSGFSSADNVMIGMRATADINCDSGDMLTAGYFKATNMGTARVYSIYSDGGHNYLKDGVETDQPSANGAGTWKLGKPVSGIATVDSNQYVEVMIDGQIFKLALVE